VHFTDARPGLLDVEGPLVPLIEVWNVSEVAEINLNEIVARTPLKTGGLVRGRDSPHAVRITRNDEAFVTLCRVARIDREAPVRSDDVLSHHAPDALVRRCEIRVPDTRFEHTRSVGVGVVGIQSDTILAIAHVVMDAQPTGNCEREEASEMMQVDHESDRLIVAGHTRDVVNNAVVIESA
jgi:hypothetical protein